MTPVIEVTGLTARTGTHRLVDGVDLTVPPGRVTALVGPSGSGKTTTALALLGEAEPGVQLGGTVRVAGRTVVDEDGVTAEAEQVRGGTVAYMPQHPGSALNPARRTGAVLTELARLHQAEPGASRAQRRAAATGQATEALRQAQLPAERGTLRRFAHQFSGGQRQRVALAQVLACDPQVLILDEPGTGLDTVTRMGLARELAALARTGPGILLLSHDHDMVRVLADHVYLLEGGRVTSEGLAETVLPRRTVPVPGARKPVLGKGDEPDAAADGAGPRTGTPPSSSASAEADGSTDSADVAELSDAGDADTASSERSAPSNLSTVPDSAATPATAAATAGLEVRDLNAWLRRGGRSARGDVLRSVSLSLPPGGCTGVAGRSGSGKTTLARCIAGLHERARGDVLLDGETLPVLRRRSQQQKRRVQYVWQEVRGSFDERRTVLDQVARTGIRLRDLAPDAAAAEASGLLDRLGISQAMAGRYPGELSGGELQRAAFARALLAAPDVLVCDEVTTALDSDTTERILTEVARLRESEGTAILWIGHDLSLLRTVADQLVVLEDGAVAEAGDCRALLGNPQSPATRLLLNAEDMTPEPDGELPATV